jgi:hypothetical protein
MFYPNPDSKRSKKRKNRGFTTLTMSCRKHRRAENRLKQAQVMGMNPNATGGKRIGPGEKTTNAESGFELRGGGAIRYH